VVVAVVLDAGRWWYGWVLHWDVVQAGCCIDRTGMMIRWGCAEKNGVPLRCTKWNYSDLTVKSVKILLFGITPISGYSRSYGKNTYTQNI
jgi:hypothetical protein